jgi:hypothetical protein
MALTADNFLQSNSGGHDGNGNVTLPDATQVGSRLILACARTTLSGTPAGWTLDNSLSVGTIYSRAGDGASSWAFDLAANESCEWDLFEITGLDPDVPIDVTTTGTGFNGSTGTTEPTTTYDGVLIGMHRSVGTVGSGTVPTFGAHTTNEELSDHGHATGGAFAPVAISTCRRFVQSLGSFECDCDPTSGTATGGIVCYTAEGAKRAPNIEHFWSFPAEMIGVPAAAHSGIGASASKYLYNYTGAPVITADGLQLTGVASIQNVESDIFGVANNAGHVAKVRFRLDAAAADYELVTLSDSNGEDVVVRYVSASQKIGVKVGTGAEVLSDATVTTGQFYNLDLRARRILTTSPGTCDWRLDYGSGPVAQTPATVASDGQALGALQWMRLGWAVNRTGTVTFRYALFSPDAGHYPLGDFIFPFVKVDPAGTPTVVGTANNFRRFITNGTVDGTFIAANVRDALDDWPPVTGASADGLAVVTAHATDYCQVPMATYQASPTGSLRHARAIIPLWAASATAATIKVVLWDGTTATNIWNETDPNADNTANSPWLCRLWKPAGGWTQPKLDAAAVRVGAADATPDIGCNAMGVELCVQVAETIPVFGGTDPLRVEQLTDPNSGGVLALRAYAPTEYGATLIYELSGVAQTPVVVAAGSNPHTVTIDAVDASVVTRIELAPDQPA